MRGWIEELQRKYHLVIYRHEKMPQGYRLETNRGNLVLHEIPEALLGKEDFVCDVYEAMGNSGFLLPFFPDNEDHLITSWGDTPYYLMAWPVSVTDWVDYTWLGQTLARFHLTSAECLEKHHSRFRGLGTWPKVWKGKVDQLRKYEAVAAGRIGTDEQDPFDPFFLENYGYLSHLGYLSLSYLQDANYPYVCKETKDCGRLAYIHFGHEQFVGTPQGQIFFVDPFTWVEDMRVRDIGQFIKSDVRERGWNPQHIYAFLCGYHSVSPLLPEEFTVMYAMFLLPGRLLKKCETLYARPGLFSPGLSPEIELFREETYGITPYQAFVELRRNEVLLREFPRFVEQAFGVVIPQVC